MQCPICGAPAKRLVENTDALVIACRRCGSYQVEEGCFNALLRLDLEGRVAALAAAKRSASPGAVPTISGVAQPSWWQRLWQSR